jgi:hypothetical protein
MNGFMFMPPYPLFQELPIPPFVAERGKLLKRPPFGELKPCVFQ